MKNKANNMQLREVLLNEFKKAYVRFETDYRDLPNELQEEMLDAADPTPLLNALEGMHQALRDKQTAYIERLGYTKIQLNERLYLTVKNEEKDKISEYVDRMMVGASLLGCNVVAIRDTQRLLSLSFLIGEKGVSIKFYLDKIGAVEKIELQYKIEAHGLGRSNSSYIQTKAFAGGDNLIMLKTAEILFQYFINNYNRVLTRDELNEFFTTVQSSIINKTKLVLQ